MSNVNSKNHLQIYISTNLQVDESTLLQIYISTNLQVDESTIMKAIRSTLTGSVYTNLHVYKSTCIQIYKSTNLHVDFYSYIGYFALKIRFYKKKNSVVNLIQFKDNNKIK